jgi:hypothetical protein
VDVDPIDRLRLAVGGLARADLVDALASSGVLLNVHAETLLKHADFDDPSSSIIEVTERSVAELGFPEGATLPQIFGAAPDHALLLCPTITGPYLRIAMSRQTTASDSVMSSGRAPTGSLTVAADVLSTDHEYPKGFYLRIVDGLPWLRGYRCDDRHIWSPADVFVFRLPDQPR